jgi:uncharacterized protein HemY
LVLNNGQFSGVAKEGTNPMSIRNFLIATAICCAILPITAALAQADEFAALDLLSRAAQDVNSGLAMVRDQISRGELPAAMATLERLMINHPDADEVQLQHASLLCRLDDRSGASVEFDALRRRTFSDRAWMDATAPCAINGSNAITK